jgi:hypothetical protein
MVRKNRYKLIFCILHCVFYILYSPFCILYYIFSINKFKI